MSQNAQHLLYPPFLFSKTPTNQFPLLFVRLHAAVPPAHRTKPWWVPNRGHNDVLVRNEPEYLMRMARFLDEVEKRQGGEGKHVASFHLHEKQYLSIQDDDMA